MPQSATAVFPLPTSPCNSRFMRDGECKFSEDLVDGALLSVRELKAEPLRELLYVERARRITVNPNVLIVPLDEFKGGNEHEIFLQGDPSAAASFDSISGGL